MSLSCDEIQALSEESQRARNAKRRAKPRTEGAGLTFVDEATLSIPQGVPSTFIGITIAPLVIGMGLLWQFVGSLAALATLVGYVALLVYLTRTAPPLRLQLARNGKRKDYRVETFGNITAAELEIVEAEARWGGLSVVRPHPWQ